MASTVAINVGEENLRSCFLMGKARKHFKGKSTGFVSDYRQAVEIAPESEGFGSSGRVDAEMTASEDSCAPKRKCISLNVSGNGEFNVPKQVLSFSKLSKSERRSLDFRLKKELELVRDAQRRLSSLNVAGELISPSSDIRGSSNVHKRSLPTNSKKGGGKKPTSKALLMKHCETLLCRLMSHQFSWVFNTPVDTVKLNLPDYHTIIKHPMDLGTVKNRLISGVYASPMEFLADVRLTFANAKKYNPPGNDVHYMADTLSKFFEMRWKSIEKKIPVNNDGDANPAKKTKINPNENVIPSITDEEKQKLSADLMDCIVDLPLPIVEFLKAHCPPDCQTEEDEIELDIDALDHKTLFELRKLLDDHLLEKRKSQTRAEPCEMEILNESGFSNSSLQHGKGNETAEEEIDVVGGNDPPVSSFPKVEIEQSKCSSSSTSSSDSGSSSDTSSSSTSADAEKGKSDNGDVVDAKGSSHGDSAIGSQPVKEDDHGKPMVEEVPESHEENPPPERRVSPDKAYRAAILRSRFADTIIKAREKALEKGEKKDPETLRLEREEFERRQKEERARLQAEAKAAEEARVKAEAEATAEAMRKREVEREAARQALIQMEKTVEINENGKFMNDLEMLRAVNEEGGSYTEENSPELSQNGLGSFKLQGSNPLEQLGLYMKADEEDDDEEEAEILPAAPDVEEGEID